MTETTWGQAIEADVHEDVHNVTVGNYTVAVGRQTSRVVVTRLGRVMATGVWLDGRIQEVATSVWGMEDILPGLEAALRSAR